MRLFNNHSYTKRLPMKGKVKKGFRTYCTVVIAVMLIVSCFTVTAFAADGNSALSAVNNLSTFIFGLIRAIGLILTGFGVVQIGLSLKSHDPSQTALFRLVFRSNHTIRHRERTVFLPLRAVSSSPLRRKSSTSLSALNQNEGYGCFHGHTPNKLRRCLNVR